MFIEKELSRDAHCRDANVDGEAIGSGCIGHHSYPDSQSREATFAYPRTIMLSFANTGVIYKSLRVSRAVSHRSRREACHHPNKYEIVLRNVAAKAVLSRTVGEVQLILLFLRESSRICWRYSKLAAPV